jgi:hypothetical protein
MVDQCVSGPEPTGGLAVAEVPPRLKTTAQAGLDATRYAMKANRIAIHQGLGRVVAMIEVVSPGNKDGRHAVASIVAKAVDFLRNGIHLLMIDPFSTGPRDPNGLDRLIRDELADHPPDPRPAQKPLTVAAFDAGPPFTAYLEPLAVGDPWPEAPLFLAPGWSVNVPLEATYRASWDVTPQPIRDLVERPETGGDPMM